MDKVLVAVDDDLQRSMPVVEHAVEIARGVGAHVTLFHVFGKDEFENQLEEFDFGSADPNDMVKRNNTVREGANIIKKKGVHYDLAGAVGSPATEIINFSKHNNIEHVFLGGRNQSPTAKALLGSTSQRVLLSIDLPCTIIM